jgi:DNA-binding NarL/FixJ family response regulator
MTVDGRTPLTVVLGQFDQLVRHGLTDALNEDPRVRIVASDVRSEALDEIVVREAPNVLIVDDDAIEDQLLARLKASQPHCRVLVLTSSSARLYQTLLRSVGANLLASSASTGEILEAVDLAWSGWRSASDRESGLARLTEREREVLGYLTKGMQYGEIAALLRPRVAPETVRTHTRRICRKLGVPGKWSLVGLEVGTCSDAPVQ